MDAIRAFFSKIRALFLIFKKNRGGLPPRRPLVARLYKIGVLKASAKFLGKNICWSLF